MQRLYSVQEATADPFSLPDPPFRFLEIRDRIDTYVVLHGSIRIGTVRHDDGTGLFVAKTTGCPNGSAPADIHRNFATRDKAAEWLSRAIDGVQPRRRHGSKGVLAAAGLALLLAAPASAQELCSDAAKWVFPVVDGETPLRPIDPPPARPVQIVPPHAAVLSPVFVDGAVAGFALAAGLGLGMWMCWMLPVWLPAAAAWLRRQRTAR